ncbi:hypothetical protein RSK20926_20152 [Roseobacter sp. SK209-2-6]|nr:hypothetical protein RSK20926_20152 [Roseobacter sp. SK209-2-6]
MKVHVQPKQEHWKMLYLLLLILYPQDKPLFQCPKRNGAARSPVVTKPQPGSGNVRKLGAISPE